MSEVDTRGVTSGTDGRERPGATDGGRTVALGGGLRVPYPDPTDAAASQVGRANKRSGTKPEVCLRSDLHRRGLRFRKDLSIPTDLRKVRPDIVFTRAKVAVFVDGCFWHGCPEHQVLPRANPDYWVPKLHRNVERDREVDEALAAAGWTVVRVWEHEEPVEAGARIEKLVRSPNEASPQGAPLRSCGESVASP